MKAILVILVSAGIAFGQSSSKKTASIKGVSRTSVSFGNPYDHAESLATDSAGNFIVGGIAVPRNAPVYRPAAGKFSSNGQILWQNTWGPDSMAGSGYNEMTYSQQNNSVFEASNSADAAPSLITRLDGQDGHIIWQTKLEVNSMYFPAIWKNYLLTVREGLNATVFLMNPDSGTLVNSFLVDSYASGNITLKTLADTLWVFTWQFTAKFILPEGKLIWKNPTSVFSRLPINVYGDIDSEGNAYLSLGDLWNQQGCIHYVAAKYSSDGSLIWETKWDGWDNASDNTNNWVNGVAVDTKLGIFTVYGATNKIGVPGNTGQQSAYIALLDAKTGDTLQTNKWDDDFLPQANMTQWQAGFFNRNNQLVLLGKSVVMNTAYPIDDYIKTFDINITDAVNQEPPVVSKFSLYQNYPNPFNPSTRIEYGVDRREYVTLTVYNVLGQKVETLVDGYQDPGEHQVIFDGTRLASGTYFYVLQAGSYRSVQKMLLLK